MKLDAIKQAEDRLERAKTAYQAFLAGQTVPEMNRAWSEFLLASGTFFTKLELGARGHTRSEPWYGRVKHERRTDPLLRYIHHARNTDEHGLQALTDIQPGGTRYSAKGPIGMFLVKTDAGVHIEFRSPAPISTEEVKTVYRLVTVHDIAHGDSFDPPTTHLGQPIPEVTPHEVGRLALIYLERVLVEAKAHAK